MRITTSAHGSFPSADSLRSEIPRIAFLNSDNDGNYLRGELIDDRLLIIGADDLNVEMVAPLMRFGLLLPDIFSYALKKRSLEHSKRSGGQPSTPMSIGDATWILDFVFDLQAAGETELLISCEYGRSRSVTVARFLEREVFQRGEATEVGPNKWVDLLMERAFNQHCLSSV